MQNKQLKSSTDAIKQAIEGGWRKEDLPVFETGDLKDTCWVRFEREISERHIATVFPDNILIDPLFWQALGKARGYLNDEKIVFIKDIPQDRQAFSGYKWKFWAIRWFETRLSNGDETKFWQSLP